MPGSNFKIDSERIDAAIEWISLEGELDLSVSPGARDYVTARLQDSEISGLVVDLSNLSFIDSTGLNVLVQAARSAAELGRKLVVVGSGPQVRRVLELTNVDEFLTLVHDREEALALLR